MSRSASGAAGSSDRMSRSPESAGILLHRRREGVLEVMLVHPGGPLWRNKDSGAWTIPKGERAAGEDSETTARREFAEELGPMPEGHTIHRIARDHGKLLVGRPVGVTSPQGRFAADAALVDGAVLDRIEPYGKH